MRRGRLYRPRLLVPAVWVAHEPGLGSWVAFDYHRPGWRIRWRWPWESDKSVKRA